MSHHVSKSLGRECFSSCSTPGVAIPHNTLWRCKMAQMNRYQFVSVVDGLPKVTAGFAAYQGQTMVGKEFLASGFILDALGYARDGLPKGLKPLDFGAGLNETRKSSGTWFLRPKPPAGLEDPTLDLGPFLFGSAMVKILPGFDTEMLKKQAEAWSARQPFDGRKVKRGEGVQVAEVQIASHQAWIRQPVANLTSNLAGEFTPSSVRLVSPMDGKFVGPAPQGRNTSDPTSVERGRFLKVGKPRQDDLFGGIDIETGKVNLCLVVGGESEGDTEKLDFGFLEIDPTVIAKAGGKKKVSMGKVKLEILMRENDIMTSRKTGGNYYLEVQVLDGSDGFFFHIPTEENRESTDRRKFLSAQCVGDRFFDIRTSSTPFAQYETGNYTADVLYEEVIEEEVKKDEPASETPTVEGGDTEDKKGDKKGDKKTKKTA